MLKYRKKFRRLSKWRKCFEVGKDKVSFAKLTMHMIPKIYKSIDRKASCRERVSR